MAKDKKKSKVGFQFTALQKRIKLLNAKILLLEEKNRKLEAEAREEWRKEASKEGDFQRVAGTSDMALLVDKNASKDRPRQVYHVEKEPESKLAQEPWYKRIFRL